MAGDLVGAVDLLQLRLGRGSNTNLRFSLGLIHRTAGGESTAGSGALEIKDSPPTYLDAPGLLRSLPALFFDQGGPENMGVGMTRSIRNAVGKAYLHDLAQVHHGHLMADEFHHPKVVRYEEVREPEPLLKVPKQVHDLSLDGDVEGARGLVGDDKPRSDREHPRHTDPPLFTARELVGEVGELGLFEAHLFEQIGDTLFHFGIADLMMDGDRFGEDITDAHLGIECRVQVLEDHLHLTPELPEFIGRSAGNVPPVEEDLPGGRFLKPQDGPADGCLAAPGFADQPHGLVLLEVEAYPVYRGDELLLVLKRGEESFSIGKMFFEVGDLEDRLRHKNL